MALNKTETEISKKMIDIIDMIFNWKGKVRALITDNSAEPTRDSKESVRCAAIEYGDKSEGQLLLIKNINDLLNSPLVNWDRNKHLKLTLPPREWLNKGKSLIILFSLETSKPITAYFENETEVIYNK